jgi:hypothetical protein
MADGYRRKGNSSRRRKTLLKSGRLFQKEKIKYEGGGGEVSKQASVSNGQIFQKIAEGREETVNFVMTYTHLTGLRSLHFDFREKWIQNKLN